ncbi:hypothetical protein IRZ71_07615 [Flavobacterium sp. ANB]|uniref:hypothetical protein n=1 Tax=unclassified Flavobacterium TaxID=196869 RepID=UPI0012B7AE32|nr:MULTISPECIES: hypothetical protein [unclassified Flavobacterium]MBF4516203.1 hypothetical protein [Flavobacterium sp. ANB]MTD69900.1 hypothetical protein [Flavobacterium sp. LC2016-13]
MKKTILILFLLLLPFYSKSSPLDTISTWKVYYNNSLIKNLNEIVDNSIVIKSKEYKTGDYLAIQYFDDMPCQDCKYSFVVIGEGKLEVSRIESKGKNKLIKINLKELMDFRHTTNQPSFVIYLYGLDDKNKNNGKRLVTLKID